MEKEVVEKAKQEAKKILDAFMSELEKVPDTKIEEDTNAPSMREPLTEKKSEEEKTFPDKFVASLPKKKGRELQAEKKSW